MEYEKGKNSAGFHFQPAPASTMFLVSSLTIKNTVRVNKTTVLVSSHSKINEIELNPHQMKVLQKSNVLNIPISYIMDFLTKMEHLYPIVMLMIF